MSIDATTDTAPADEVCELCGQTIRKGWRCVVTSTYTDTAADCELTDYCHTECVAMTEDWTDDDWDSFSDGEIENAIQWPTYDEQGSVISNFDPPCGVCGRPRSIGCADRFACEFQAFAELGSCDPAAMAELMREEPDE